MTHPSRSGWKLSALTTRVGDFSLAISPFPSESDADSTGDPPAIEGVNRLTSNFPQMTSDKLGHIWGSERPFLPQDKTPFFREYVDLGRSREVVQENP